MVNKNKEDYTTAELISAIIEGVLKKKGKNPVSLDLTKIENSFCSNFIICHGDSNTQVEAIADSVQETVRENIGLKVSHKEGLDNATWVLLDYSDVIVHIFQPEYRDLYKLEDLWADAELTKFEDVVK
ncbi:MAG: ribosome silencing factor [Bacteroidales bacterium]